MIIYLEIELQKKKLLNMIEAKESYEKILKQSQKVDKLINKYYKFNIYKAYKEC